MKKRVFYCFSINTGGLQVFFANLHTEAAVVGAVCGVFLLLFIVSGIRQILKDRE